MRKADRLNLPYPMALFRSTALRLFTVCALSGCGGLFTAQAETLLEQAFTLDEGVSVPRDATAAAALYRAAAEQEGDAFAMLRLGYLHETGDGVTQDYTVARTLYQSAVDRGLDEARLRLAICHLEGWGGPVDRAAFLRELIASAEADYVPAQRILSSVYFMGFGVPADPAEGIKWVERAARLNDPAAQLQLGRTAEALRRIGLMPDLALARDWYKLSAEQEYVASMRAMARSFFMPSSSDFNVATGRRWLELATECGDAEAPYMLALSHLLHPGGSPPETAEAWLRLSSQRGNARASEVLELAAGGRTLADAARYVLSVPMDERFLQRAAEKAGNEPTRPPVPYRMVRPVYPATLRLTETEGEVTVAFVVTTKGLVTEPKVVSSTHPLFSERAIEAVSQWRFHPGRRDGQLVNTRLQVPVYFTIRQEELKGVDAIMNFAVGRAAELGGQVADDAQELQMAKPVGKLPVPKRPNGESFPAGSKVLLILVLDSAGRAQRAHILDAQPEELGPAVQEIALRSLFEPRMLNGEAVPSNALLIVGRRR